MQTAEEWAVQGWVTALSWIFDRSVHSPYFFEVGTVGPALAALAADGEDEGFSKAPEWLRTAVIDQLEADAHPGA